MGISRAIVLAACVGAALALAGCQTGPGTETDIHTGTKVAHSGMVSAYTGLFDFMHARAYHSNKGGYGLAVSYSNYGWIYADSAWSYGTQLPYTRGPSSVAMCGGAGGCITTETGRISLTEAQFRQAAKDGFAFELVGTAGKRAGKVPAKAFQAVLDQGV